MADGVSYSLKGFDQYEVLLGDELRGERATIGKSLLDVQRDLKIKASYIAAIENCDLGVFSNLGFVAGYVRSYARYLGLDPDSVYERFCRESGFASSNTELASFIKKAEEPFKKNFGSESTWKPGQIGHVDNSRSLILESIKRITPALLVFFVLMGSIWGAMSVLKQVQKLDIVAFEEPPEVFSEPAYSLSNSSVLELSADIYSSEELALPVFEPRDKALSSLKPELLTALEDRGGGPVFTYQELDKRGSSLAKKEVSHQHFSRLRGSEPVVRTTPHIPSVEILAVTPAWVRVRNGNGDVVLEQILKQGETYRVKKNLFKGRLRAGNAQNVYFIVDEKAYGPLSED